MKLRLAVLLVLTAVLFHPAATRAQWQPDGVGISTAVNGQVYSAIVSDGLGGSIVAWQDDRNGTNSDIYAQRIGASGVAQWPVDEVAVCTDPVDQFVLTIVADGVGGAIVAWDDFRTGNSDIYAQRISASGVVQWQTDGVAICTAGNNQDFATLVSDGTGGGIATWLDHRSGGFYYDIYAQRINASGVVQWATDGVPICSDAYDQRFLTAISDGTGGVIATWQDGRNNTPTQTNYDVFAQRVNGSGVVQWTTGGVAVLSGSNDQAFPTLVLDGAGGVFIALCDGDITAQRVSAYGALQWGSFGKSLCNVVGDQSFPKIVSDGTGGAVVAWQDRRSGSNWDIYAQRIDASGLTGWTSGGVAICIATIDQVQPAVASDGEGGGHRDMAGPSKRRHELRYLRTTDQRLRGGAVDQQRQGRVYSRKQSV